ncbi:MAG: hypothetical protein AAGA48_24365 [Myxococcota bacterium]
MTAKLAWINTVLLVLAGIGLFVQNTRIHRLEQRLDQVAQMPRTAPADRPQARLRPMAALPATPETAAVATPAGDGPNVATIDDHLWSESGRAAIDDVVAERETRERDQMRERWQQLQAHRIDQAITTLTEEHGLDEGQADDLHGIVTDYLDARSSRWQRMRDPNFDPAAFQDEMRQARATAVERVEAILGPEGFTSVEEAMGRGRF